MKVHSTGIKDLCVLETSFSSDKRGSFSRIFCANELSHVIDERKIVQINRSTTIASGTVRGMHYQNPPHAELKIVHCTKGKILDIAVDLRAGSKTFLKWHAEELSCQNNRMLIIPEGFAHGFQSLTPNSEILYLHTNFYKPEVEDGVLFNDTRLAISWPLPVSNLSDRDKSYCLISNDFSGIEV